MGWCAGPKLDDREQVAFGEEASFLVEDADDSGVVAIDPQVPEVELLG
jgi:hypothetical protein